VANTTVSFSIGSGGDLSASSATTDADGRASVVCSRFKPDGFHYFAASGGKNGSAQVSVASTALFISIFRGSEMTVLDVNTYQVPFTFGGGCQWGRSESVH
jgi:hypothetical protein